MYSSKNTALCCLAYALVQNLDKINEYKKEIDNKGPKLI